MWIRWFYFAVGGMLGAEYSTLNYGPMDTMDIGLGLKNGNILFIGAGFRKNIPLKSDDAKAEASAPGSLVYKSYGNLLFLISYKF